MVTVTRETQRRALHPEEVDIEQLLAAPENAALLAEVDAQGPWVANELYENDVHLASLRLRAGLSQAELARRCGMQQPNIARLESGRVMPHLDTAAALAGALGVTLDEYFVALQRSVQRMPAP